MRYFSELLFSDLEVKAVSNNMTNALPLNIVNDIEVISYRCEPKVCDRIFCFVSSDKPFRNSKSKWLGPNPYQKLCLSTKSRITD